MTGLWLISYIALWILFLLVAIALISVLRNLGVIYESLGTVSPELRSAPTKLVTGDHLPDLTLYTLSGGEVSLSETHKGKTAFLIVSPRCSPCHSFLKDIAENGRNPDPLDPSVRHKVIVSIGNISEQTEVVSQIRLSQDLPFLVDTENLVAEKWGITTTPTTVIVDDQQKVVRHIFGSS